MRRALVIIALSALASVSGCKEGSAGSAPVAAEQIPHIDGARARALVGEGATLLDVRTKPEFDGRHADGAVNIPVGALAPRMAEVPRDKPVVVYCESGGRSARAADMLKAAGYDVHDLESLDAWNAGAGR